MDDMSELTRAACLPAMIRDLLTTGDLDSKIENLNWLRMAKVLLRNDYWCKGLGYTQPKSEAYGTYLAIKRGRKERAVVL